MVKEVVEVIMVRSLMLRSDDIITSNSILNNADHGADKGDCFLFFYDARNDD